MGNKVYQQKRSWTLGYYLDWQIGDLVSYQNERNSLTKVEQDKKGTGDA